MGKPAKINARDKILDAAEHYVVKHGAGHLTLDAIAEEAGVSKGGLLYHFRSKDLLISGLIERVHAGWMEALSLARSREPAGIGYMARVLHRDAFDETIQKKNSSLCERHQRIVAALSAAIAHRPDLLKPIRETYRTMLQSFEKDDLPLGKSLMMMCAYDALWWSGVFGTYELTARQKKALQGELEVLLRSPVKIKTGGSR